MSIDDWRPRHALGEHVVKCQQCQSVGVNGDQLGLRGIMRYDAESQVLERGFAGGSEKLGGSCAHMPETRGGDASKGPFSAGGGARIHGRH